MARNWIERFPVDSPAKRNSHATTYDQGRQEVLLFGGLGGATGIDYFTDTWVWNGVNWTDKNPATTPGNRVGHKLVYHPAEDVVMMFGGINEAGTRLNDTWVWDGTDWTDVTPVTSPQARYLYYMDLDQNGDIVLTLGQPTVTPSATLNTWLWDGNAWTLQSPGTQPSVRAGGASIFDGTQTIIFGGASGIAEFDEVYAWDGSDWTLLSPATTHYETSRTCMGYLPGLGALQYGGSSLVHDDSRTWIWTGSDWVEHVPVDNPGEGQTYAFLSGDWANDEVMLFGGIRGGHSLNNETWVYTEAEAPPEFVTIRHEFGAH